MFTPPKFFFLTYTIIQFDNRWVNITSFTPICEELQDNLLSYSKQNSTGMLGNIF